uniref:CAZy families GT2 protein n=1 Tax=uncultured Ruegeria sp. TaxID=259304 RepID=A0A060C5Y0_9RHOB|nr:CAZy families GT2 protein [uncultured Ruegeria sp.]
MRLSLVIPVRNDAEGLTRLLSQARSMTWLGEIIVFDDASDPPCGPNMAEFSAAARDPRIRWLRGENGRARAMPATAHSTM